MFPSTVVAGEWPTAKISILPWHLRSGRSHMVTSIGMATAGPIPGSHVNHGGRGEGDPGILTSIEVASGWPSPAFSRLSICPRSGKFPTISLLSLGPAGEPIQHSHFYPGGHGFADPPQHILAWWQPGGRNSILTPIGAVAERAIPHSHFDRGGHGMADPAFSLLSWQGGTPSHG